MAQAKKYTRRDCLWLLCVDHHGANESKGSRQGHVQGRHRRSIGDCMRSEEDGCVQMPGRTCSCRNARSEEDWCVHSPRFGTLEDPHEASNKSREARSVRKSRHGQGKACKEDREGIPRRSLEGEHLNAELFNVHPRVGLLCVGTPTK